MKKILLLIIVAFMFKTNGIAQCDTIVSLCNQHVSLPFISDGQQYRAFLLDEEIAEFHATFYSGTTYRIAACSGLTDGNLIFRVFDNERNLLFTSSEFRNAPYWDFDVKATVNCIIEAQLDISNLSSGCAVLLIGFKQ